MTFLWTGYLITWIALVAYAWRLERRIDHSDRRLDVAGDRDAGADRTR